MARYVETFSADGDSQDLPISEFAQVLVRESAGIIGGSGAQQLHQSLRVLLREGQWRGANSSYGGNYAVYQQYLGASSKPSLSWASSGFLLTAGTRVTKIIMAGRTNSNDIESMDYDFTFRHGPWNAGWDSNGETALSLAVAGNYALRGTSNDSRDQSLVEIDVDFVAPATGVLIPAFRPVTSKSSTRYWYGNMILEVQP
ncbi:MAG: hypothetical protein AB8B85_05470 [Paracoccaceae bacterium]